jgi:integrase
MKNAAKWSKNRQNMSTPVYDLTATVAMRLDTRRPLKTGRFPSKIDVYYQGRKKRYDTKISFSEEEWDKIASPKLKDETLKAKRTEIKAIEATANEIVDTLGENFTFDSFEILFLGGDAKTVKSKKDVYAAFESYIDKLKAENRIGSANACRDAMKSLSRYTSTLEFRDITVPFLEGYEKWMTGNGKSATTVGMYLRSLRTIVNIARADRVISDDRYPFGQKSKKKYEIPRARNIKKALDETAVAKIVRYEPLTEEEAWARDMWLFSFFCNGMNMIDIFGLKYESIMGDFIYFHRQKTIRTRKIQEPIEIFISEPIRVILDRWGAQTHKHEYIFDVFKPEMTAEEMYNVSHTVIRSINGYMKRISKRLGINVNITTYVARHTWATTLLRNGISTAFISKGLGHSSFATTEQYLGGFTQDQKRDVAQLLTKIG